MLHEEELDENRFMPSSILPPFLFLASLLKITGVIVARDHSRDRAGGAADTQFRALAKPSVAICEREVQSEIRKRKHMSPELMCRAIALALGNVRNGMGGPFAALVVKDGRVLAEGTNRVTSSNDPTAHAEIAAIREACRVLGNFELTGCELYATCEPCPMCLGAIYWARLARVFYGGTATDAAEAGFDDAFIYAELKKPFEQRRIPMMQILREESFAIFAAWKQLGNKKKY